jgi:enoyl-CoA hydratase/carnithine racemase
LSDSHVIVDARGPILRVQIDRPEKKNSLTVGMYTELDRALKRLDEESDLRVLFLTGSTGCFTAGNDLADFLNPSAGMDVILRFLRTLAAAEKPLVAAVSGWAVGIGVTMLLHCDLVYAGDDATLKTPFVDLGLVPEAGSSLLLPSVVGHRRAAELLLLGESLDATTARSFGLVNDVFPAAELDELAWKKAEALAARAPSALRASKRLMKRASKESVLAAMEAEEAVFMERLSSPELSEAVGAFMQKRKADFSKFS